METNGQWGGHREIIAAANRFHVNIVAVSGNFLPVFTYPNPINNRNPTIYIIMQGADRGRETHWQALIPRARRPGPQTRPVIKYKRTSDNMKANNIARAIINSMKKRPNVKISENTSVNNIARAIFNGLQHKPPMSHLGSPTTKEKYSVVGVLRWLGKDRAYVYKRDSDGTICLYNKNMQRFVTKFNKWVIKKIDERVFTLEWDDNIEENKSASRAAGVVMSEMRVSNDIARAIMNGIKLSQGKTTGRKKNEENKSAPKLSQGKTTGQKKNEENKSASREAGVSNNIARAIMNGIKSSQGETTGRKKNKENTEKPGNKGEGRLLNRFKEIFGKKPNIEEEKVNQETLNKYKEIIKNDELFGKFLAELENINDEYTFYRKIYIFFESYDNLERKNKSNETSKKDKVRKLAIDRINTLVNGNLVPSFRYELVGNYKKKIKLLQLYMNVKDGEVRYEAEKHLKRFKLSARTVVQRPPRNMYYGGGAPNYSGAISSANKNYRKLRSIMRARRTEGGGREANMLRKLQLQQALAAAGAGTPTQGYPGYGEQQQQPYKYGGGEPEYEALKKLTQPPPVSTTPQPPVQQVPPAKLYGVSAQSEERIKKNLTPTEKNVVLRAGNLAAVDRILKAAGGTSKVRQAAEILKQVPKNEALKLRLVSKKAAAAVDIFGGPNKANAAIKVNQKITSARKKKKYKKTKTLAKKKVVVSPLRTKVLKDVIAQVPKNKLIQIAGKSVLGINEKGMTPKKIVVNDFTKYVQRKAKPVPKGKAKPKAKSKAKPKPKAKTKKSKAAPKKK